MWRAGCVPYMFPRLWREKRKSGVFREGCCSISSLPVSITGSGKWSVRDKKKETYFGNELLLKIAQDLFIVRGSGMCNFMCLWREDKCLTHVRGITDLFCGWTELQLVSGKYQFVYDIWHEKFTSGDNKPLLTVINVRIKITYDPRTHCTA